VLIYSGWKEEEEAGLAQRAEQAGGAAGLETEEKFFSNNGFLNFPRLCKFVQGDLC
jgi:hypothetical protein